MSDTLNIAVLGAGVMGLTVAHALQHHNVTLFDPAGFPAKNASAMAGGMLAPYAEIDHLPPEFIEAGLQGISFWENLPGSGFQKNGTLLIAHGEDEYILERLAQKLPAPARTKISDIEPDLKKFETGIFIPEEAHINPALALKALINSAPSRISESRTPAEIQNQYDWIIDCRGLAANNPGLRGVKGENIIVKNKEFTLSRPARLMHPRYALYIVPRPDHEFMIGATVIESEDSNVTVKSALELLSAAYSLHPSFGEAEIIEIRAGVRPAYPDNLPRIKQSENIISCNGLFRHGYLLAPVMAACTKDLIENHNNEFTSLFMREENEHQNQRHRETNRKRA